MNSLQETLLDFLRQREAEYEFRRQEFEELDRQITQARKFLRALGYQFEEDKCEPGGDTTIPTPGIGADRSPVSQESSTEESTDTSSKAVKSEDVRDWIRDTNGESFTRNDLAKAFRRSDSWASLRIEEFKHMLEKVKVNGPYPDKFRYAKPAAGIVNRVSSDQDGNKDVANYPVAGTGKFNVNNKEVQRIVNSARANGCSARKLANGHIELSKNGASVQISGSPSTNGAYDAMRRQIRRVLKVSI